MEARTWICPALCGCEIRITGLWPKPRDDGRSYQLPIGWVDTRKWQKRHFADFMAAVPGWRAGYAPKIDEIVSACAEHFPLRLEPAPHDQQSYPKRSKPYLTAPERLYAHLWGLHGNALHLDCGCVVYMVLNERTNAMRTLRHPEATVRCERHANDDDQHTQAMADNRRAVA